MRFNLCAGFISGLVFATGVGFMLCSDKMPLALDVLLMVMSAFFMGVLLGENDS